MVSPQKITYNGMSTLELNPLEVIIDVSFDSDSGATSTYLNRSAVAAESHDGRYRNTARYKYDELFSPQFTIVKEDFSDFTREEVRKILKYLTSTDKPALLEVYYDKDSATADWCAIGGFTSIETYKLGNNRIVGIVAQFEAITPYAMSALEPTDKTVSEDNHEFTVDTDDNRPVYPKITIQQNGTVVSIPEDTTYDIYTDMIPNTVYSNGTTYYWKSDESALCTGDDDPDYGWTIITRETEYTESDDIEEEKIYYYTSDQKYRWIDPYTFKSSTEDPGLSTTGVKIRNTHTHTNGNYSKGALDALVIKNNTSTEKIVIDCANKIIVSSNTRRIIGDDFNLKWLELYDGTNEISVEGNCSVDIEWRTVVKCGEY